MSSLARKLKRSQNKKKEKLEKKLTKKLNMFEHMPENCLVCEKEYDKNSREQAMSWRVVVKADAVRLYCPECWLSAEKTLEEFLKNESK
tara:strand:- start:107 stop:373 length:267 start_codon:yes stop_codon:yes gene_type:complete